MNLEVISRRPPNGDAHATPLLFVHGAFGSAWLWDRYFLPYFAEKGYAAHALSLRGHGESGGREILRETRLRDYVADVDQVIESLPAAPVLIGHSMGGMVVQKVMHARPLPGAVLMASCPPHGMLPSAMMMSLTHPRLYYEMVIAQFCGPSETDGRSVRNALFSNETPLATVVESMHRFSDESLWVSLDLLGLDLVPSTPRLELPVLVVGAENDPFVQAGGIEATADTYRTKAEIFPGMAHAMMLEAGWQRVAERIHAWLGETLAADKTLPRRAASA